MAAAAAVEEQRSKQPSGQKLQLTLQNEKG
jgi:hypothetical protein